MICDIIKTVLVILVLRQDVYGNHLNLYGIPEITEENSVFRLRCQRPGIGFWYKTATFQRNSTRVATVTWKSFWGQYKCSLSVYNGESGYGCESSPRTKTLVIYNINKTRDSNTVWSCRNNHGGSNQYILPIKTDPPQCELTTNIRYNKPGDQEVGDKLVLSEGDDLYLNCSASIISGNHTNDEITYQWKIYEDKDETYNGSVYVKPNITRLDGAMYMCTSSIQSYCTSSNVTYIQIQYALSLNITVNNTPEAVELVCRVVDGYPTNFTMNNWRHYIDGQFVREIEGVTTEDRTALVLNNTILNKGTYVCNASNDIKDLKGSVYQTNEIYITIEANNDNLISSNDELPVNVSMIAGVVVGAAVLIGVIILIIILVRRRSNHKSKSAGTIRQNPPNSFLHRNPTYDTSHDQPTNDQCLCGSDNLMKNQQPIRDNQTMEIMENDLYISASDETNPHGTGLQDGEMEIMENDLYISADEDRNVDGVETKPEMEIIENDLYIPLEIDTRIF